MRRRLLQGGSGGDMGRREEGRVRASNEVQRGHIGEERVAM